MQIRTTRALLGAAALALFTGACTDTPTNAPAARAPGEGMSLTRAAGSGPTLVSNAVKYRDQGGKPSRGRSGNAVLQTFAMLDRAGLTTLSVTTRHATDAWVQPYISRVQVQASSAGGKHIFTRNLNGLEAGSPGGVTPDRFNGVLHFRGLGRGDQLRVQANVRGADGNRTDVVTVTETVRRLPELRVRLAAPAEVETATAVNLLATVSEANGDLGTHATCELYVAGQLADVVENAWVDAGDAVTCALTWSFTTPGSYPVEVRVRSSTLPEWDAEAGNTAAATVQVNGDSPTFYTSASFSQTTRVDSTLHYQAWRDGASGLAGDAGQEDVSSSAQQQGYLYAYMPVHLRGDLYFDASMSSGGNVVSASRWANTGNGPDGECVAETDGPASLWTCTYSLDGAGTTFVQYAWMAGTVTYHSRAYSRMWDALTGTELSVYHWNTDYGWGTGLAPLGNDWRFEVRVSTPTGEHVAAHTLRLERQPLEEFVQPYTCNTFDEPFWDYSMTVCDGSSSRTETILGL